MQQELRRREQVYGPDHEITKREAWRIQRFLEVIEGE